MSVSIAGGSAAAPPPSSREAREATRSKSIYGLRGIAALCLVFTHVGMISGLIGTREAGNTGPSNWVGGFIGSGFQICAGVFFLMTGLFLYRPFARSIISGTPRKEHGVFLRRALRLLPAYYVVVLVSLLLLNLKTLDSVWSVLRPVLLLQVYDWSWYNGLEVTWTVPAMAQYYLAIPALAWLTGKWARRGATPKARAYRLMAPVPFLIAIGFAWLAVVKIQNMGTRALFWWPMGLAPEIGIGMAIGVLIALAQVSRKDTSPILKAAAKHPNLFLLGAVVVLFTNALRPFSQIGMDDIYTIPGLVIFYVLLALFCSLAVLPLVAGKGSRTSKAVFANPPLAYVGKVSYGVYLWHFAVMHFILQPVNILQGNPVPIFMLYHKLGFPALFGLTIGITLILASLSYYLVELPLQNWGERFTARRQARRAPLAAVPDERPEQPGSRAAA